LPRGRRLRLPNSPLTLVSLSYLQQLTIPALWRGRVQLIPAAGHAPHWETPSEFASLLEQFIAELR